MAASGASLHYTATATNVRAPGAAISAGDIVLLLDMTMPEMNGDETLRDLRRVRDDVWVIPTS